MLSFDMRLGPGATALPEHIGGALHGFVEGATLAHAPQLLGLLRPGGQNDAARFAVHAPPVGTALDESLRFGLVLFGDASEAWPVLVRALIEQTAQRFHGRCARIERASIQQPGSEPVPVVESGRHIDPPPQTESQSAWLKRVAAPGDTGVDGSSLHVLSFRSPLLLASRYQVRARLPQLGSLPWPTLGQVLDSVARRMRALEPDLARVTGCGLEWRASETAHLIKPLTPAADPARQVVWAYSSTPRARQDQAAPPGRRTVPVPGILGTLMYRATADAVERQLLYWGQWLGVGQKTTMGFGSFVLSSG